MPTLPKLHEVQIEDKQSKLNTLKEVCIEFGNSTNSYPQLVDIMINFDYTNPNIIKSDVPLFNFAGF